MSGMHDPGELSAHALGLLGGAQARAVEQHLAGCAACRREWSELRETAAVLDAVPPEMFLDGPPGNDLLLQRTLREIRSETGRQRNRRRLRLGVAAAVVAAALLGAGAFAGQQLAPQPTVIAAPPAPPAPPAGTRTVEGTQGAVSMPATVTPANGWIRLAASVRGIPPGEPCELIVLAKDGSEHVAGSWVVGVPGPFRRTRAGSTIIDPAQVSAIRSAACRRRRIASRHEAGEEAGGRWRRRGGVGCGSRRGKRRAEGVRPGHPGSALVAPDGDPAARARLLGLEDAAERGRAGRCSRSWPSGSARRRGAARAPRACTRAARATSSTRSSRSACSSARTAATPTRRRPTCSSTAPSPPTSAACWRWRTPACIGFWGSLTEGLRTGAAAERGEGRRGLLRDALRRPRAAGAVPARDERDQRRRGPGDRGQVPLGRPQQRDRRRLRRGRRAGPGRARARAPHRRRLRPAAARADLRAYVARFGLGERLRFTAGDFFADPLPKADVLVMGHILHDWDLDEKRMLLQKAYEALPDGGALIVYEAIIDDERREQRVRAADEPEHADRDAGRLRLHRRRLPALDARRRASARATSSTSSAPTRWSSGSNRPHAQALGLGRRVATGLRARTSRRWRRWCASGSGSTRSRRRSRCRSSAVELPAPRMSPPDSLAEICADDPHARTTHALGKATRDIWRGFRGRFENPPDVVARPRDEAEVEAVLGWCSDEGSRRSPTAAALRSSAASSRGCRASTPAAVSIDLGALDRVLEVDEASRVGPDPGGRARPGRSRTSFASAA